MAKQKGELRKIIYLACNQCQQRTYVTEKNSRNDSQRLELNKYCPYCRIHTLHRETR